MRYRLMKIKPGVFEIQYSEDKFNGWRKVSQFRSYAEAYNSYKNLLGPAEDDETFPVILAQTQVSKGKDDV